MLTRHRMFGRRPNRHTRTTLHVGVVLAMLGALLLVPVVTASAGGEGYQADLSVSQTDTPDPVTSGNDVLYEITVVNNGPNTAHDVTLSDTLDPSVTFVSASAGCDNTVECTLGNLGNGGSAIVHLVVEAPSVSEQTTITNHAEASDSSPYDPHPDNNVSDEDTTVQPQTEGAPVTGYIPPEGGRLTTDTGSGATSGDSTVLTEKFGPGPGGEASVQELDECDTDPLLQGCFGNIGDFQPPPGYDKVVAVLLFDRDAVAGGLAGHRKMWIIDYEKNGVVQQLSMCGPNPVANDQIPCWKSIVRVGDRDLRVRAFINSDPKLAGRK
jgi:uncharacterized repeat protein (TIGR01451 family)